MFRLAYLHLDLVVIICFWKVISMLNFEELKEKLSYRKNDDSNYKSTLDDFIYLLDNAEIRIERDNTFFVRCEFEYLMSSIYDLRGQKVEKQVLTSEHMNARDLGVYKCRIDHGHTSPDWGNVFKFGLSGLKKRAQDYLLKTTDAKKREYYGLIVDVYDAAIRFVLRTSEFAHNNGKHQMAQGLKNLTCNPPSNLFEAMQLSLVFYMLQHNLEGAFIRTMGRLDTLLMPFVTWEDDVTGLCDAYLKEINSYEYDANIPFALSGTDMSGNDLTNQLSHIFLEEYAKLKLPYVKLHILYSEVTDKSLVRKALDAIRKGANSIVFVCDKTVKKSLEKLGISKEDYSDYAVVGCYEAMAKEELPCTCSCEINLAKVLEIALNNGGDMYTGKRLTNVFCSSANTYDELYAEFLKQLKIFCKKTMELTNELEKNFHRILCAPFLSSTYNSCMENGGDIYSDYSAGYNNTSLNALGIATVVDSLMAIKFLLSAEPGMTIDRFREILKNNWENHEILRRRVIKNAPKYGNGNMEADLMAKDIVNVISSEVNGKPNSKGGVYRLGTFSIDWRIDYGKKTSATPDGRLKGEPISQNTTASFGADKNGATSHILSMCTIDQTMTANGSVLDLDLHQSAVKGEAGLNAFKSLIEIFEKSGGFAIHINVLNADTLKKARLNPELYPNLQVRLCGWNALFSKLGKETQNELIMRAESLE